MLLLTGHWLADSAVGTAAAIAAVQGAATRSTARVAGSQCILVPRWPPGSKGKGGGRHLKAMISMISVTQRQGYDRRPA